LEISFSYRCIRAQYAASTSLVVVVDTLAIRHRSDFGSTGRLAYHAKTGRFCCLGSDRSRRCPGGGASMGCSDGSGRSKQLVVEAHFHVEPSWFFGDVEAKKGRTALLQYGNFFSIVKK